MLWLLKLLFHGALTAGVFLWDTGFLSYTRLVFASKGRREEAYVTLVVQFYRGRLPACLLFSYGHYRLR